eukprot:COSAG01_NODE_60_length_29981_cov_23.262533_4_plen_89_part_00
MVDTILNISCSKRSSRLLLLNMPRETRRIGARRTGVLCFASLLWIAKVCQNYPHFKASTCVDVRWCTFWGSLDLILDYGRWRGDSGCL